MTNSPEDISSQTAFVKFTEDVEHAMSECKFAPHIHKVELTWNDRKLVVETFRNDESRLIFKRTYRTLCLNGHFYFEDGSIDEVTKLIAGLSASVN
jgi:hypothetical protein